jgi:hypothetical protein
MQMLIKTLEQLYEVLDKMAKFDREHCHQSREYMKAAGIDYFDDVLTMQANIQFFLRSDK